MCPVESTCIHMGMAQNRKYTELLYNPKKPPDNILHAQTKPKIDI
jgi:hypothetical protein